MENKELIKVVVEELCCVDGVVDLDTIAKDIIALVREHDGWVSVADALPEKHQDILVIRSGDKKHWHQAVMYIRGNGEWSTDYYVTHWRPLPAPPTTEKE